MKPDIVAEIDRVLALAALATPGEWATIELFPGSVYCDDATGSIVANCYGFTRVVRSDEECIANATVIPAAVNLIRNPNLRRLVEDGLREDGVGVIAKERAAHATREGWTPEHDDEHDRGELAQAAACYALPPGRNDDGVTDTEVLELWPWGREWWKPGDGSTEGRIGELAKAGALIAAEIDRLKRAQARAQGGGHG